MIETTPAEKILGILSRGSFDNFYNGEFEEYIVGITDEKAKQKILGEIEYMFAGLINKS